jgi:hypothetical protein
MNYIHIIVNFFFTFWYWYTTNQMELYNSNISYVTPEFIKWSLIMYIGWFFILISWFISLKPNENKNNQKNKRQAL